MKLRRIVLESDFTLLQSWWAKRGTPPPILALLPPIGILCEMDDAPAACAWLYNADDNLLGIVEWVATNPNLAKKDTATAVEHILNFFEDYCREHHMRGFFSWVKPNSGLRRLYDKRGWVSAQGEAHELMAFTIKEDS
jgi:hypothetical protein